ELSPDLGPRHAQDGAVEVDVLAPRQLRVESGPNLQQARHPALDSDAAGARLGDAGEDLEESGLAGAVAADDAHHLTAFHFEGDTFQRPEFLHRVAYDQRPAAQYVGGGTREPACAARDHIAQGDVALTFGLVADQILLADALGADDGV